jgi:hypothetical protein
MMEGDFAFRDETGGSVRGKQRLFPEMTFKDGRLVWDWNSRSGTDWRKLPADTGVRPGMDFIVPPPQGR